MHLNKAPGTAQFHVDVLQLMVSCNATP